MRIQHNIMAMSAYRNYTNNVSAMKGNLEKLSSGYKINRAGDDAAGLAISEKMRAQITGLKQAQANAKSGINLVQTAEGALQEVQDMMNRMVKLAEQSANGTYDETVDRNQLQKEFEQLKDEINRINKSANFNGINLFGGPDDAAKTSDNEGIETYADGDGELSIDGTAGTAIKVKDEVGGAKATYTADVSSKDKTALNGKKFDGVAVTWDDDGDLDSTMAAFVETYNGTEGKEYVASYDADSDTLTLTAKEKKVISAAPQTDLSGSEAAMTSGTTGAAPTTAALTMNASTLNKENILAAATSAKADDKITISVNSNKELELKVGSTVVGTSAALDGSTTDFEFKSADGKTSFGTVKFSAAPAANEAVSVETGLSIKGGGDDGDNDKDSDKTVASEKIAPAGVDFEDKSTKLDQTAIDAIKAVGKVKINSEVEVDLSTISLTANQNTGEDAAKAILNLAKDAVDDWNKENGEDKGYTYTNVRISKTADGKADGDIIAQGLGDGVYILADKKEKAAGATPIGSLNIQIGDTGAEYNKMKINRYSISSASIKDISEGTGKTLDDLGVDTEDNAREALSSLKGMVNYISDIRGELGAKQNRLNHTINNLSVMEENIQDAESTIRDTDVADEMMAYTKNNILIQSAQAMLAQANQVPQGVLQLLQ